MAPPGDQAFFKSSLLSRSDLPVRTICPGTIRSFCFPRSPSPPLPPACALVLVVSVTSLRPPLDSTLQIPNSSSSPPLSSFLHLLPVGTAFIRSPCSPSGFGIFLPPSKLPGADDTRAAPPGTWAGGWAESCHAPPREENRNKNVHIQRQSCAMDTSFLGPFHRFCIPPSFPPSLLFSLLFRLFSHLVVQTRAEHALLLHGLQFIQSDAKRTTNTEGWKSE